MSSRRVLDTRGRGCPIPILLLKRTVAGLDLGEELEVLADDRSFPADVGAWCEHAGQSVVSIDVREDHHVVVVRRIK